MIKSISIWAFPGGIEGLEPAEAMEKAKKLGFDAIELAINERQHLSPASNEAYCRRVKDAAKAIGIRIASVACGLGWSNSLSDPNARKRKAAVKLHAKGLEITRWLGTDAMLVVPGYVHIPWEPKAPVVPYDLAYRLVKQSLRELGSTAEKLHVHACCEMVWNGMLYSPLEFQRLLAEVGNRYVNFYFDTANMMAFGYPEQWVSILGKRIKRVHFKDYQRDPGGLASFCDLLKGDVNYPAVMKALRAIKYTGPVTLETFNRNDADLRKESRTIDKILKM